MITKSPGLLDSSGNYFEQSKPLYETYSASDFIIATANRISNDVTGDQYTAINTLLANNVRSPIYFPSRHLFGQWNCRGSRWVHHH